MHLPILCADTDTDKMAEEELCKKGLHEFHHSSLMGKFKLIPACSLNYLYSNSGHRINVDKKLYKEKSVLLYGWLENNVNIPRY